MDNLTDRQRDLLRKIEAAANTVGRDDFVLFENARFKGVKFEKLRNNPGVSIEVSRDDVSAMHLAEYLFLRDGFKGSLQRRAYDAVAADFHTPKTIPIPAIHGDRNTVIIQHGPNSDATVTHGSSSAELIAMLDLCRDIIAKAEPATLEDAAGSLEDLDAEMKKAKPDPSRVRRAIASVVSLTKGLAGADKLLEILLAIGAKLHVAEQDILTAIQRMSGH